MNVLRMPLHDNMSQLICPNVQYMLCDNVGVGNNVAKKMLLSCHNHITTTFFIVRMSCSLYFWFFIYLFFSILYILPTHVVCNMGVFIVMP